MKEEQIELLFSMQRDITIGVRDGEILFANSAAKKNYSDIIPGSQADILLPEELLTIEDEKFTTMANIRDRSYTIIGAQAEDIRIYTLIPVENTDSCKAMSANVISSMRSPLTILNMAVERLAPAVLQLLDANQSEYLASINKSYYQLRRLSDNLEFFFRLQDNPSLSLTNVDIVQLCNELVLTVSHFISKCGLTITLQSDFDQLIAAIDRELITTLLLSLFSNSIKYMKQGDCITLKLTRKADTLYMIIEDTGSGVPAGDYSNIFTKYNSPSDYTDIQAGMGIGLSIAQYIAQRHGGSLILTSTEGVGTKISVSLPIQTSDDSEGLLEESAMIYGRAETDIHTILTELSDVLDREAYSDKYLD